MKTQIIPNRISLANIPTPIQKISFEGKSFYLKRDDFTGLETSGNKIRKLEYLLYQAKKEKADYVFTCGGDQSNHARATAFAAAFLGLKSKLFLWGKNSSNSDGNLFLDKIVGSELRFLSKKEFAISNEIMEEEKISFEKKGKKVFLIPEGGSSPLGIWGYIHAVEEMQRQNVFKQCNSILTASGSGGTTAGLLIGSLLINQNLKIIAVNVLYTKDEIRNKILSLAEQTIKDYRLPIKLDENRLEILEGYSQEGYKHISDDKLSLIKKFASKTGIIFDPAYTGKAFKAYHDNFLSGKMSKTLFIHTGGLYGVFSKRKKYLLNYREQR
ncbi:MAG: pyridoxal-phosphate dependent enzyme [Ignavibacteria bacterium]|nr:pyridoxal-phosphate dependent enzyme [Ignavibacteria bacterium]